MKNDILLKAKKHLKNHDKVMAGLINSYQIDLEPNPDYFGSLIKAIIDQQLNLKVANLILGRFNHLFKNNPTPQKILEIDNSLLREIGLSSYKIGYLKDLALKTKTKELDFLEFNNMNDQDVINSLIKVKGIGLWSAQIFLIFSLARINVLPYLDGGLKKAVSNLYGLNNLATKEDFEKLSLEFSWKPYQTVASLYLWKSLNNSL